MALKPIKMDSNTRKELSEKLDPRLILTRKASGTTLSYISQNTCVDILNHVFGHNWSMKIVDRWMEPGYDQVVKQKQDWSTKTWKWPSGEPDNSQIQVDASGTKYYILHQGPVAWCIVELTVPIKDEETGEIVYVTKSGFGSQAITGNQNTQATNGYKGAQSDALKKAATLFGIALELYREPIESQYFDEINEDLFVIWTDETKKQYKKEWDYIDKVCTENGYTYEDLAWWVSAVTDEQYSNIMLMPIEYMESFIEALKEEGL